MSRTETNLPSFLEFLDSAPTSYHCVAVLASYLKAAGFGEVDEKTSWAEGIADTGFVCRDGAAIAWRKPSEWDAQTALRVFACHTDSPALKIKPRAQSHRSGFGLLPTEVYGGPILPTWLDRNLSVAGRIIDASGNTHLVVTDAVARVPALAVHLDRSQRNELTVDAQRDLNALICLDEGDQSGDNPGFRASILERAGIPDIDMVAEDLFLVPAEPATRIGINGELVASYRLDNLASVFSGLNAIVRSEPTSHVQVFAAFDHEEIGSGTPSGATGPFLEQVLRRFSSAQGFSEDDHIAWFARGAVLSADVTHGIHPNRGDRHDSVVHPTLGKGPVLKCSAPMRYATDASTAAYWARACEQAGVSYQIFVNNNNIPGGTTLGPLLATRLGIRTCDAGVPVLGMHSVNELCASADIEQFNNVAQKFLELA